MCIVVIVVKGPFVLLLLFLFMCIFLISATYVCCYCLLCVNDLPSSLKLLNICIGSVAINSGVFGASGLSSSEIACSGNETHILDCNSTMKACLLPHEAGVVCQGKSWR